ncbi:hypothetical protein SEA_SIXAMA_94 [Gordonia phage Sixama]|uniref:Uncharacterized protein n=1 Tax=Gordonia phage Sixama TaxID=2653271 RepID=A0A5Q2F6C5_9CAUD|nr:hypothetical protein PP302_gp094 [Gordonia phage Sixama]QGF20273.1 hypothetical protein SEA_SIXAMA_94 [Gordonia phage Sixama]
MEIVWNEANFDYMFHSWSGPTGRYIKSRVLVVEQLSRAVVGVQTGALKASIGSRFGHRGKALEAKIGANVHLGDSLRNRGYAYYHHEGTLPHLIKANKAKALHFMAAGMPVYAHSVHHPGTIANPYLTLPMNEVF